MKISNVLFIIRKETENMRRLYDDVKIIMIIRVNKIGKWIKIKLIIIKLVKLMNDENKSEMSK